jgi:hypothetical protein
MLKASGLFASSLQFDLARLTAAKLLDDGWYRRVALHRVEPDPIASRPLRQCCEAFTIFTALVPLSARLG